MKIKRFAFIILACVMAFSIMPVTVGARGAQTQGKPQFDTPDYTPSISQAASPQYGVQEIFKDAENDGDNPWEPAFMEVDGQSRWVLAVGTDMSGDDSSSLVWYDSFSESTIIEFTYLLGTGNSKDFSLTITNEDTGVLSTLVAVSSPTEEWVRAMGYISAGNYRLTFTYNTASAKGGGATNGLLIRDMQISDVTISAAVSCVGYEYPATLIESSISPWLRRSEDERFCLQSCPTTADNSTFGIYITFCASANDVMSFDYKICGGDMDGVELSYTLYLQEDGASTVADSFNSSGTTMVGSQHLWETYSVTIPQDGNYSIIFRMDNVELGDYYFCLDNLKVSPKMTPQRTINVGETDIGYTVAESFQPYYEYNGYGAVMASTNHTGGSTATLCSETVLLKEGDVYSFDYKVTTEDDYDVFRFYLNDECLLIESGYNVWQSYSGVISADGWYTFRWEYTKDLSADCNGDTVYLDCVNIPPMSTTHMFERDAGQKEMNAYVLPLTTYTFEPTFKNGSIWLASTNQYINSTNSILYIDVNMKMGETFRFDYMLASEANYDKLVIYNYSNEIVFTGVEETDGESFATAEYTAPSDGVQSLMVMYQKDLNVSLNGDTLYVKDFRLYTAFDEYINGMGGSLHFDTMPDSEYPFVVASDNERDYVRSSNMGVDDSASSFSLSLNLYSGDTISFDYWVSSEETYDKLVFAANGNQIIGWSGTDSSWQTYTYEITESGAYTFTWMYIKDGSASEGGDMAKIDNVSVPRLNSIMLGDVNIDGVISSTDALLAMRGALGIISLMGVARVAADINGDGAVTSADALIIMRLSLGLS